MRNSNSLVISTDVKKITEEWSKRSRNLKRNKVELPDLTDVINPQHDDTALIIQRMKRFDYNRGGLAANTVSSLTSALKKWRFFCSAQELYAFPLHDHAYFELFLKSLVLDGYSISTVKQTKSLLSSFYDYLKIDNPAKDEDVKALIKSLIQDHIDLHSEAYRQSQATPMRIHNLHHLYQLNDEEQFNSSYLSNMRDIAFLAIAYSTCLRIDEIRNLKPKHIKVLKSGKIKINRTRSKTSTNVKAKYLTGEEANRLVMYMTKVRAHLSSDDYLFTWITSSYRTPNPQVPITKANAIGIFHRQYKRLSNSPYGIEYTTAWSGHSGRVGHVIDAKIIDKVSDWELMQLGEWTTMRMVSLYLRNWMEFAYEQENM